MSLNLDKYQEFATFLEQLRSDVNKNQVDAPTLRQRLGALHQFFIQQIVPLGDVEYREQSYQTEMSKQLRLLEIDVMFFQGAKQSATAQARLKTIEERLTTLIRYCHAIIQPEQKGEK
ncbi:heterocyst frequency control protein PatD [Anabaena sp. PCC 7108]|uniref:heterocyst frequency control protein PatD n=1 Tax=Anabaena sp. PCC 7108 TaxID=163908 RepID=UPI00034CA99C|nr:heterocyst frequency control protein PatD [Anabaena sp. PCC 7108]